MKNRIRISGFDGIRDVNRAMQDDYPGYGPDRFFHRESPKNQGFDPDLDGGFFR